MIVVHWLGGAAKADKSAKKSFILVRQGNRKKSSLKSLLADWKRSIPLDRDELDRKWVLVQFATREEVAASRGASLFPHNRKASSRDCCEAPS
jgi:hypothetical protein